MVHIVLPDGERVVSWTTVWNALYPEEADDPHDDEAAAEMHRLRGLIMAQAAETEDVLGHILRVLDAKAKIDQSAGRLLRDIMKRLGDGRDAEYEQDLNAVDTAIKRRNFSVHSAVTIGSIWVSYSTGGGEWQPVISLMGGDVYDEVNLREDLACQQEATAAAVRVLRALSAGREQTA